MKVALDFDGTLADTGSLILLLMNWRLGTSYKMEDWDSWGFWAGMSPEAEKAFWGLFDLMDESYLRRALPPMDPFAPAVVKWLMKRGHEVNLVTVNSNTKKALDSFNGWLWAQGIEMPVVAMGRTNVSKAELDYDLFIDDSPRLAEDMGRHQNKKLILLRRPLNKSVAATPNVYPAENWEEVKEVLLELGA